MSAETSQVTFGRLGEEGNGVDLETAEPITHHYDRVGHIVIGECCVCCSSGRRRLLERDYDLQEDFKKRLAEGDNDYMPAEIYRHCEWCGKETTHFVC